MLKYLIARFGKHSELPPQMEYGDLERLIQKAIVESADRIIANETFIFKVAERVQRNQERIENKDFSS